MTGTCIRDYLSAQAAFYADDAATQGVSGKGLRRLGPRDAESLARQLGILPT